jgi:pyrroloquinoline quinone (PQQ) biosynthesis protein C
MPSGQADLGAASRVSPTRRRSIPQGALLLPAFEKHYGFKRTAPEIEFFTEHDAADVEHSRRQIELCGRHLDTPQLEGRAEQVAQEICELRWASISELYRSEVLGEKEILPPGVG